MSPIVIKLFEPNTRKLTKELGYMHLNTSCTDCSFGNCQILWSTMARSMHNSSPSEPLETKNKRSLKATFDINNFPKRKADKKNKILKLKETVVKSLG